MVEEMLKEFNKLLVENKDHEIITEGNNIIFNDKKEDEKVKKKCCKN